MRNKTKSCRKDVWPQYDLCDQRHGPSVTLWAKCKFRISNSVTEIMLLKLSPILKVLERGACWAACCVWVNMYSVFKVLLEASKATRAVKLSSKFN